MKRFGMRPFGLLALLVLLARPSTAQSSLTFGSTLTAGGVSYHSFTVTTAGTFDIWTTPSGMVGSTPFDPALYLFSGFGTGGGLVGWDDDGCGNLGLLAQCGAAVPFYNSILNDIFLGVGDYTAAVGGVIFFEAEARSGVNSGNPYAGAYDLRVASLTELGGGTGVATGSEVVPEPATMSLLATGLAGMAGVGLRRRRKQA